jgi:sulfur carrier protein
MTPETLLLNGQPWTGTALPATLAGLLAALDVAPETVATAVNGQFVPREQRATHRLHAGDSVTTFQPIVGG